MSEQQLVSQNKPLELVMARVRDFQKNSEIHFPAKYSPDNALKAAWLMIQETVDKDKKLALSVCTQVSVANAMLSMAIQGLNPIKKQCYFIVYGNKLTLFRSYFGEMAVTKSMPGVKEVFAEIVYKKDEFEYEMRRGKKRIVKHNQKLENVNLKEITAAYCIIEMNDGEEITEIMTWEQIQTSWLKSQSKGNGMPHKEQPDEMAKRTIIRRACKAFINSSDDSNLMLETYKNSDKQLLDAEVDAKIEANANTEPIDIQDYSDTLIDYDTGEILDETNTGDGPYTIDEPLDIPEAITESAGVALGF